MQRTRFGEVLHGWLERADTEFILSRPSRLLNWCLAQVLLGETPTQAREAFEALRKRPEETKNPRRDVEDWSSLAAACLLFGESWAREAELCLARVEKGLDDYGTDRRILEPAMAIARLLGDSEREMRWRELRLRKDLQPEAEAIGFEVLYLSSRWADEAPLEELPLAVARVGTAIIMNPLYMSIAPHLMLLKSRLGAGADDLAETLRGQAAALDRLVFGEVGATPLLVWSAPVFSRDREMLRMTVTISGSGRLSSGAHSVSPVTHLLSKTVLDYPDDVAIDLLSSDSGRLVAIVRLDDGIEISPENRRAFAGRTAVAWEHLRAQVPQFRSAASLVFED